MEQRRPAKQCHEQKPFRIKPVPKSSWRSQIPYSIMQFPGRDLDKVHCVRELRRGRGERSLHCSDQGQPIWLISAESNKAEFFMQPYLV